MLVLIAVALVAAVIRLASADTEPAGPDSVSIAGVEAEAGSGRVAPSEPDHVGARAPVDGDARALFRGRCVDVLSGQGIAGADVQMAVGLRSGGRREVRALGSTGSGADGGFALRAAADLLEDAAPETVVLVVRAEGYAHERVVRHLEDGHGATRGSGFDLDLGEVRLTRGRALHGTVATTDDAPLPEARVQLMTEYRVVLARADRAGRFSFDPLLAPGDWTVSVVDELGVPRTVVAPEGGRVEVAGEVAPRIEVRVAPIERIVFLRVTTAGGAPVDEATVLVGDHRAVALADDRSRFAFDGAAVAGTDPVRATHPRYVQARDLTAAEVEATGEILMVPVPAVTIRVLDAPTRRPVEQYGIRVLGAARLNLLTGENPLMHDGRHADGVLEVELPVGRSMVAVEASDYVPAIRAIDVGADPSEVLVELAPLAALSVTVIDAVTSEPVASARVTALFGPDGSDFGQHTVVRDLAQTFDWRAGGLAPRGAPRLTVVTTDALGNVRIGVPPDGARAVLVESERHVPRVHRLPDVSAAGESAVVIALAPAAVLKGRVGPSDFVRRAHEVVERARRHGVVGRLDNFAFAVQLRPIGGTARPLHEAMRRAPVAEDGSYELPSITPGDYRVVVVHPWTASDRPELLQTAEHEATTVRLGAGEVRVLDVDASSAPVPVAVRGEVLLNGRELQVDRAALQFSLEGST